MCEKMLFFPTWLLGFVDILESEVLNSAAYRGVILVDLDKNLGNILGVSTSGA